MMGETLQATGTGGRDVCCRLWLDRARPLSCLLTAYLSDEYCSYRERAVGDREWKCRETARGRSEHDLRISRGLNSELWQGHFRMFLSTTCDFVHSETGHPA
jgi:hypothetical protein